jgi:GT2 family glycosyltransferase
MPSIDVSIVTWNSGSVIRTALDSVFAQTQKPDRVFVVDNASVDNTREIIANFPQCILIQQDKNIGFAAAHNIVINQSTADYVLVMNPDVILQPEYFENIFEFANTAVKGAAFVGTVNRQDGSIDTTGLSVAAGRLVKDITNRFIEPTKVFGISGALALYRRAALQDVVVDGSVFNPILFAYKEDVELAWRLQWAGWQAYSVPGPIAQHNRVMKQETRRNQRSVDRRFLSYRNHLLLYPLVESWATLLPNLWAIIPAEIFRFLYLLFTDPQVTIRALAAAAKMWHAARTFAHRERRAVKAAQVRAAFNS